MSPEDATDFGWNQQGAAGAQFAADAIGADARCRGRRGIRRHRARCSASSRTTAPSSSSPRPAATPSRRARFAAETGIPVVVFDAPSLTAPGLVADVLTNAQEGAYLAGVLAATMSQTGILGMVISADTPSWHKANGGFVAGAQSVNPDIQFLLAQIGEDAYADAEAGNRTTAQVIAGGADIVFGQGDGSSFGMMQAVETATPPAGADKVWFIDVIGDKTSIDTQGVAAVVGPVGLRWHVSRRGRPDSTRGPSAARVSSRTCPTAAWRCSRPTTSRPRRGRPSRQPRQASPTGPSRSP